uniref:Uncharacterized protein n=1 Tax=Biomphalaria glabrata TaxID=6526 RepID=A0A2C9M8X2_BIOGL
MFEQTSTTREVVFIESADATVKYKFDKLINTTGLDLKAIGFEKYSANFTFDRIVDYIPLTGQRSNDTDSTSYFQETNDTNIFRIVLKISLKFSDSNGLLRVVGLMQGIDRQKMYIHNVTLPTIVNLGTGIEYNLTINNISVASSKLTLPLTFTLKVLINTELKEIQQRTPTQLYLKSDEKDILWRLHICNQTIQSGSITIQKDTHLDLKLTILLSSIVILLALIM